MSDSSNPARLTLDNSGLLAALAGAREAMNQTLGTLGSLSESLSGLGAKFAAPPGAGAFAGGLKDAMNQGRQFVAQARQVTQSVSTMGAAMQTAFQQVPSPSAPKAGASDAGGDKETNQPLPRTSPLDHFKAPDIDRWAKVGLFLGGAPQTPGLSEARRAAKAAEESCKLLKQVLLKTDRGGIGRSVYAE
jgi:hypothetical protein